MRHYNQVSQGYGDRHDFTKQQGRDKADFTHNYDKMGSIKYQMEINKKKGTTRTETFGNTFSSYEKAMIPGVKSYYLGKG